MLFDQKQSGRPKTIRSEDNIANIQQVVKATPTKSIRQIANDTNINS